jgi:transketolase
MKMDGKLRSTLGDVATSIRSLSMDAIQTANSGHPGLPLGCAEIGAVLYGKCLRFSNRNLDWINRDRFVLSAGHGSMFLYSLLHLSNSGVSLDDLRQFRQLGSITPGHPEVDVTPGVEMTTGPLGQGLGTAVGMALGGKILASKFNSSRHRVFDYTVYTLAGDGCMMEGLSSEVSSFAGHYQLDNLVVLYDANDICLDGNLKECFSDDVNARFCSFGFETCTIDGHDVDEIFEALQWSKNQNGKPKLIICKTTIGKGSPNKSGTSSVHGSPLGAEEIRKTKENLGLSPDETFQIIPGVSEYFNQVCERGQKLYQNWAKDYEVWQEENPDKAALLDKMRKPSFEGLEGKLPRFMPGETLAGRKSSQACIQVLAKELPSLIGGSADLSCSDSTGIKEEGILSAENYSARNIKFGVREFGMSAISSGLALTGFFTPYCGTFLTFSDYLRPSLRLASLIGLKLTYQFTHDSVFLGEDGPTHQPVEHAAALRTIPGFYVFRPADGNEVRAAWIAALNCDGPRAILLSRQNLPHLDGTDLPASQGVGRGAYKVLTSEGDDPIDRILFATGSELHLALEVGLRLMQDGERIRVISIPCFELFEKQDESYQQKILAPEIVKRYAIEAQVSFGWHRFTGLHGKIFSIDQFGISAPASDIAAHLGFTADAIFESIQKGSK